jgi:hypothetical protein
VVFVESVTHLRQIWRVLSNLSYSALCTWDTCGTPRSKEIRLVCLVCESWSLSLREERRLRVFENKVLRRIFGPKRDEVTGEWRRLHNKELYALYSSQNIIRVNKSRRQRWAGHVARMGRGKVHTGL